MQQFPDTDTQQLRALIRQARKDAPPEDKATVSQGLAPRKGRAYRELFQLESYLALRLRQSLLQPFLSCVHQAR